MGRLRSRIQSRVPPGSEVREVPSDGSCMYWSIKLACEAVHGLMVGVAGLQRQHVVAFMLQNTDYWGEFMEEDSESDLETRVQQYTESILEGKWGDHLELECLAQMHDLHITVVEEPGQTTAVNPTGSRMIYLAFYSECSHYEAVVQPLQTAAQPRSEKILGQQQQHPQPVEGQVSFTGFVAEARAAGVLVSKPHEVFAVPQVVRGLGIAPVLVNNIIRALEDTRIVLITTTGGVCSGKTSMGDEITDKLRAEGHTVIRKPENVTTFLNSTGYSSSKIPENLKSFQSRVFLRDLQLLLLVLEDAVACRLAENKVVIVLADRSALDGKAFATNEIWEYTLTQAHLDEKKLAMTLGKVIFLETAAIGTDAYRTGKGTDRWQTLAEAVQNNHTMHKVYEKVTTAFGVPIEEITNDGHDHVTKCAEFERLVRKAAEIPDVVVPSQPKQMDTDTPEWQPKVHIQAMQNYVRAQLDKLDLVAKPGLDVGRVKDSICDDIQGAIDATRSELKHFGLTNKSCTTYILTRPRWSGWFRPGETPLSTLRAKLDKYHPLYIRALVTGKESGCSDESAAIFAADTLEKHVCSQGWSAELHAQRNTDSIMASVNHPDTSGSDVDMSGDEDDTHSGDADLADHHCHLIEEPLVVQEKQQRTVTFDARPTVIKGADQLDPTNDNGLEAQLQSSASKGAMLAEPGWTPVAHVPSKKQRDKTNITLDPVHKQQGTDSVLDGGFMDAVMPIADPDEVEPMPPPPLGFSNSTATKYVSPEVLAHGDHTKFPLAAENYTHADWEANAAEVNHTHAADATWLATQPCTQTCPTPVREAEQTPAMQTTSRRPAGNNILNLMLQEIRLTVEDNGSFIFDHFGQNSVTTDPKGIVELIYAAIERVKRDWALVLKLFQAGRKSDIHKIRQFTLVLPSTTIFQAWAAPFAWLVGPWLAADKEPDFTKRPEIHPVTWEPRPTVDVDNLHRLQKLCKPTDKETVRQLREGVLNNAAPQKAMMIMSHAPTFYQDMEVVVRRVTAEEIAGYLRDCEGHFEVWPTTAIRMAAVIGTAKSRVVYHHNLPLLVSADGTEIDYSLNSTMDVDAIPVEAKSFPTPEQHARNVAIDMAIYEQTKEDRHKPVQLYGDMSSWFRSFVVCASEQWAMHVINDKIYTDLRHGFGGRCTPFVVEMILNMCLHFIRTLTVIVVADYTCYDVVSRTIRSDGDEFLIRQLLDQEQRDALGEWTELQTHLRRIHAKIDPEMASWDTGKTMQDIRQKQYDRSRAAGRTVAQAIMESLHPVGPAAGYVDDYAIRTIQCFQYALTDTVALVFDLLGLAMELKKHQLASLNGVRRWVADEAGGGKWGKQAPGHARFLGRILDLQTGMIRNCADRVKQLVEDIHSLIRTAQLNKRKVPFRAFRKMAFVLSYVMQIEGKRAAMNAMWRANAAPIKPHDRAPDSKWLTHLSETLECDFYDIIRTITRNSGRALCPSTAPPAPGTPIIVVDAAGPPKVDLTAFAGGGGFIYQRDGKSTQWASEKFGTPVLYSLCSTTLENTNGTRFLEAAMDRWPLHTDFIVVTDNQSSSRTARRTKVRAVQLQAAARQHDEVVHRRSCRLWVVHNVRDLIEKADMLSRNDQTGFRQALRLEGLTSHLLARLRAWTDAQVLCVCCRARATLRFALAPTPVRWRFRLLVDASSSAPAVALDRSALAVARFALPFRLLLRAIPAKPKLGEGRHRLGPQALQPQVSKRASGLLSGLAQHALH
eukprot:COSAG06_NODE_255_length_19038_cov_16.597381_10_plen_1736_part_00